MGGGYTVYLHSLLLKNNFYSFKHIIKPTFMHIKQNKDPEWHHLSQKQISSVAQLRSGIFLIWSDSKYLQMETETLSLVCTSCNDELEQEKPWNISMFPDHQNLESPFTFDLFSNFVSKPYLIRIYSSSFCEYVS